MKEDKNKKKHLQYLVLLIKDLTLAATEKLQKNPMLLIKRKLQKPLLELTKILITK